MLSVCTMCLCTVCVLKLELVFVHVECVYCVFVYCVCVLMLELVFVCEYFVVHCAPFYQGWNQFPPSPWLPPFLQSGIRSKGSPELLYLGRQREW
jgi:hypothetical protein